jgi:hypothetical protein
MTKIYYDTEFLEDGKTIELISIGLVSEYGHEYYAVNSDAPWDRIRSNRWLCDNVVRHLPLSRELRHSAEFGGIFSVDNKSTSVKPEWVIANEVREFILAVPEPELWADYGAYDHVVLCQLWGAMIHLPKGIPMWTNDLQQAARGLELPEQVSTQHNALEDARQVKIWAEWIDAQGGAA